LGECVFECGVAVAFAGVGGVDGLFLCGECGGEAELVVVGGEPDVEDDGGEEERGAEGDDFDCAAGGHGSWGLEAGSWRSGSSLLVGVKESGSRVLDRCATEREWALRRMARLCWSGVRARHAVPLLKKRRRRKERCHAFAKHLQSPPRSDLWHRQDCLCYLKASDKCHLVCPTVV